jgi:molybdopterin biosynthesis enzyme
MASLNKLARKRRSDRRWLRNRTKERLRSQVKESQVLRRKLRRKSRKLSPLSATFYSKGSLRKLCQSLLRTYLQSHPLL